MYVNRNQWGNDWSKESQYKTGSEMRIARLPKQSNNCGISTYALVPETIEERIGLNIN